MKSATPWFVLCVVCLIADSRGLAAEPRNLEEAILNYRWTWNAYQKGKPKPPQVDLMKATFQRDGMLVWDSAELTAKFPMKWRITGAKTVELKDVNDPFFLTLTFDDSLTHYKGRSADGKFYETGTRLDVLKPALVENPASSVKDGAGDFEKNLLRNRWTWPGSSGKAEQLFFQQGGIVINPGHWIGTWTIKNAAGRSVVIRAPFFKDSTGAANPTELILVFDRGMTSWTAANPDRSKLAGSADGSNRIEGLALDFLDITNQILAPLDKEPPGELRNQIVRLKEGLKDEAATAPQANPSHYDAGERLCDTLVMTLEQRENYVRRLTGGSLSPKSVPDLWAKGWADSAVGMRKAIESQYGQFRDGVRMSSATR